MFRPFYKAKFPSSVFLSAFFVLFLGLPACDGDGSKKSDQRDTLTGSPDDSDGQVLADTQGNDSGQDAAPPMDGEDASDDAEDAIDPYANPFESEDDSRRFFPGEIEAPKPSHCLDLVNPDAETGDLSGWLVNEGSAMARSEYPGSYEGEYAFKAKNGSLKMSMSQTVSGISDNQYLQLRVMLRSSDEMAELSIGMDILNAANQTLKSRDEGPLSHQPWRESSVSLKVPEGGRSVRIFLKSETTRILQHNAWFDNISLCVFDEAPFRTTADIPAPPYLMNPTKNSVSVLMESRKAYPVTVHYGLSPDKMNQSVTSNAGTKHVLRLQNLSPHTRYYYQVAFEDAVLPPYDFRTARDDSDHDRIEFVMLADNQEGPDTFERLAKLMASYDPDFVLHGGDVVQNGTTWDYQETFFSRVFGLSNLAPMILAKGNHETYSSGISISSTSKRLWESYVDQPNDKHCFGFRWGALFILVLDTEEPHRIGSEQYACAKRYLESEESESAVYRLALFHRPPLIQYWEPITDEPVEITFFTFEMDAPDVREYLAPLLERHRVQLVFNGHNHLYQFVPRYPYFTAWVTSGGGGGGLESGSEKSRIPGNDFDDYIEEQIFGSYHFLRVIYQNERLWVRAIDEDDHVLHEFMIMP